MAPGPKDRIFVALDTPDIDRAARLAAALAGAVGGVKIGQEFFTAQGPGGVRAAVGGARLLLDLKFHDIPNSVAGALRAAARLRPFMVTVHAAGGRAMMRAAAAAARQAAEDAAIPRPKVLGVTVLTSLDEDDLAGVGQRGPIAEQARRLAALAKASGLDGVVCSPREVARLRALCGADFVLLVPGIRPAWAATGDQKRVMTPAEAVASGADYLVIGRPITAQPAARAAARRIANELAEHAGAGR
ncbi:MAG: orotidine-5'-phosphate decarboxylase [Kiloniellaceae bacterium]